MRIRAAVVLLALLTGGCASVQRWGGLAVTDAKEAARAPFHASKRTWMKAGVLAGSVVAAKLLDDEVADALQTESRRADRIAENVEPFGGRYSDRVLAGFLAGGLALRDERAKAVAFDGFVSSLLASRVLTPALKQIAGRRRPGGGDDDSFPSNHATQAFAVASVVTSHYDSRWVDAAAYGLATIVGASRVRHDAHYFSDVVAGAIIGTATGRFIVRTNESERATWNVQPLPNGRGLVVRARW